MPPRLFTKKVSGEFFKSIRGEGAAEQVALYGCAAHFLNDMQLLPRFHPFRHAGDP